MGKLGDEILTPRFVVARILYDADDLGSRRLAKRLLDANAQNAADIEAAADNLIVLAHVARHRLAGQGHRVERRLSLYDRSVEGNLLPRLDDDGLAQSYRSGVDGLHAPLALHMGRVGPDIHQLGDALAALVFRIVLEEFAYLEEEHHEDCLGELVLCAGQESDT